MSCRAPASFATPVPNRSVDLGPQPQGGVSVRAPPNLAKRAPVDPATLESATLPPANKKQSATFPGHVANSICSRHPIYVLVGGRGWMKLDPGERSHPDLDVDGVLHAGGFRKIGDGSDVVVVDGDLQIITPAIFSFGRHGNFGDWRPGAPAVDANGLRTISPGEIMDGSRDAYGLDSAFAPPANSTKP